MTSSVPKGKAKLGPPPPLPPSEGYNGNATKKESVVLMPKQQKSVSSSSGDEKICEIDPPIQEKYKIFQRLGKGAYGIVWEALELKPDGKKVALKKIYDAFRNNADSQRTYREIFFLLQFGHHPNIISLTNGHRAQNDLDFYLCFPLMRTDLHKVVKNAPNQIGKEVMRSILYQVSKAVLYLHSANVIHRDIKPANILLDKNLDAKLGDFGLARSVGVIDSAGDGHPEMTDYVATRWYRPPEILLNSKIYSKAVDIWALACILGEMAKKQPIFAAANTMEQIEMVLGTIEKASWIELSDLTSENMRSVAQSAMKFRKPPIRQMLLGQEPEVIDLMEKILVFSPQKRPTIEQVIAHPLLRWDRCVSEEIRCDHSVKPPIDDNVCLSLKKYRSLLYEMLQNGELPCPDPAGFQESMTSGTKREKIRKKRKVAGFAIPSSKPGFAENGGGDASKTVDHASFHSFPNPAQTSLNQVQLNQEKSVDEPPEGKFLRESIKSRSPSRKEVKLSKGKRAKKVPKDKPNGLIKLADTIKGTDDSRGPFKPTDSTRKLMERLGTAPPSLQARGPELPQQFYSSSQFRPQSRGHLSISIPTAADASMASNKSKLPRPITFKTKLFETVKQLGSMTLGFGSRDSDVEQGGGDMRRPSTTLPFSRSSAMFPRLTEEASLYTREHSTVTMRQFPYCSEHASQSDFLALNHGSRDGRPQTSEVYIRDAFRRHGHDSLFVTPELEPQTSLSFIDERPVSRASVRNIEIHRDSQDSRSSWTSAENKYPEEIMENWKDRPAAFPNPQRESYLHAPAFEKPIVNNRKKSPAKYREKLKNSSYFPGVELNDHRRIATASMENRNSLNAFPAHVTRETQRSRIAAKMNNLAENVGSIILDPHEPDRKKSSSRPWTYANHPPPPTRPVLNQMGRLPTMAESRVPPFENYTKAHATISSKDLDDLKATFARVGRY